MRKIWIDCDPGHDDAFAIMVAHAHPEAFDIVGYSTVGGNVTLEKVSHNLQLILTLLGSKVPCYKGAEGPLLLPLETAPYAHGDSGLDGHNLTEIAVEFESTFAPEAMAQTLRALPAGEKLTLMPTGPLTNIALLLKGYPDVWDKIDSIVLMGGGTTGGNRSASAEFNIFVDPEAAAMVFRSGLPIVMAGLQVTDTATMLPEEYEGFKTGGKVSQFASGIIGFYAESARKNRFGAAALHDVNAIMAMLKPELYKSEQLSVDVSTDSGITRGQTIADRRANSTAPKNVQVLTAVDRPAFAAEIQKAIAALDEKAR